MTEASVLFVCMGNICRSPTAHGVMRKLLLEQGLEDRISVDSAGTHAYHVGEAPDPRSQEAAAARSIDLSDLRARAVEPNDFQSYDLIVAMDKQNLELLEKLRPAGSPAELRLMLSFAEGYGGEVPDPYYGGADGFEQVLDMLEEASRGLLRHLSTR